MKDFSFFDQARKYSKQTEIKELGCVSSISRRDFEEEEAFAFTSDSAGLEYAALLIESKLLLKTQRGGRLYVGFGKLSLLKPVLDRYLRIADLCESVFVFGEPDWKPPRHPNMRIISLQPDFKLAHESFLIADSPTIQVALLSHEDDRSGTCLDNKGFSAVKTSNSKVVGKLANAAEGLIDWSMAA